MSLQQLSAIAFLLILDVITFTKGDNGKHFERHSKATLTLMAATCLREVLRPSLLHTSERALTILPVCSCL